MRVLLVKLSSLGDVVHAYPALADAAARRPDIRFDWLVDEGFAPLARLHPAVDRVIALPFRRFRKAPRATWPAMRAALSALRAERYEVLIDAQGLIKSAAAGRLARADIRHGFARGSAREGLAALAYDVGHDIPETEHMAARIRRLFAASLGYSYEPELPPLRLTAAGVERPARHYVVLIHGTSWKTKTWTVAGWRELATRCGEAGLDVVLFAQGPVETERAARIADGLDHVRPMPPMPLEATAPILAAADGVVTVDTGLGHLAAALGVPTIGLYGPTDPKLTGLYGAAVTEIVSRRDCAPCERTRCAIRPDFGEGPPCMADLPAERVFAELEKRIKESGVSP